MTANPAPDSREDEPRAASRGVFWSLLLCLGLCAAGMLALVWGAW